MIIKKSLWALFFVFLLFLQGALSGQDIEITKSSWHIEIANTSGDAKKEIIYASRDGVVVCLDATSYQEIWKLTFQGSILDMTSHDITGDGMSDILIACSNGQVILVTNGQVKWAYDFKLPVYNVEVGSLDDQGPSVVCGGMDRMVSILDANGMIRAQHQVMMIANHIHVADLDGDRIDDILVIDDKYHLEKLELKNGQIKRKWRKTLVLNPTEPNDLFEVFSLTTVDFEQDKVREIILGSSYKNAQRVVCLDKHGNTQWVSDPLDQKVLNDHIYSELFSTAFIQELDVDTTNKALELLVLSGGNLRVLNKYGELIDEQDAAIGFTCFVIDGKTMYLGSSPNGDHSIYTISFDNQHWKELFSKLQNKGRMNIINDEYDRLLKQVKAYQGPPVSLSTEPFHIVMDQVPTDKNQIEKYVNNIRSWFQLSFPDLMPTMKLTFYEKGVSNHPQAMSRDEILEIIRFVNRLSVPVVLEVGHSNKNNLSIDTIGELFEIGPSVVAVVSGEDQKLELLQNYTDQFVVPLLDLCTHHNREFVWGNKTTWWASVPAIKEMYQKIFQNKYKKILVAASENSNSRTPEINLFSQMGLFLAGDVRAILASTISDSFNTNRFGAEIEYPKHAHPFLRSLVMQTLLGGGAAHTRITHSFGGLGSGHFTNLGQALEIYLWMLQKEILFFPKPEQLVGVCPVGVVMHEPPQKWLIDAHNNHQPNIWDNSDIEMHQAFIPYNGCVWAQAPTPPHALQFLAFNKRVQGDFHIPETPYGPVAIIPESTDQNSVPFVETWWHTDGIKVWSDQQSQSSGQYACDLSAQIKKSLEQAADKLPFRIIGAGVFYQTLKITDDIYRVYVIDSGWLNPDNRFVTFKKQISGSVIIKDLLSQENIIYDSKETFDFVVPAGSLRIFEVKRNLNK